MKCPNCNAGFSFWYSFTIVNPWKHRCPGCGSLLTGGRRATIAVALAALLGLAIASVAIIREEANLWTAQNSLLWFAFAFAAGIVPYQYWCWKWVRFTARDGEA